MSQYKPSFDNNIRENESLKREHEQLKSENEHLRQECEKIIIILGTDEITPFIQEYEQICNHRV